MKISLITVCYNSEKTIEDTIKSVISQKNCDIQYIIIDGGSKDNTVNIIQPYLNQIAYFHSKKDKGIYDAMNIGISKASGDVIGFLNADDVFANEHVLSSVCEAFNGSKAVMGESEVDAVYADLIYVKADDLNAVVRYWQSCPFKFGLFAKGWSPAHPTFYVKKSVYERYGVFDLSYPIGTDIELMMRFLEKEKIRVKYVPKLWVKMRVGGVSNGSVKNILAQNKEILKAFRAHHIKVNPVLFWLMKISSRLNQFLRRPEREHVQ